MCWRLFLSRVHLTSVGIPNSGAMFSNMFDLHYWPSDKSEFNLYLKL